MSPVADFHTHILPGIDDGSRSVEQSLAMLAQLAQQGVEQVVATPHFYPMHDDPRKFLARRARAEARLREAMAQVPQLPALTVGAEVHYFPGISESDILRQLTIGENGCILIEMPMTTWTEGMYRELAGIWEKQGIVPIVAHVDRYIRPLRTRGIPGRLAQLPVYVQANASFFLDRGTQGLALRLLKQGHIHLLGSDCHDLSRRPPNLGPARDKIRKKLGQQTLDRICDHQKEILKR